MPEIPLPLGSLTHLGKWEETKGDVFHISNTTGEFIAARDGGCQKLVKAPKAIRGICGRKIHQDIIKRAMKFWICMQYLGKVY